MMRTTWIPAVLALASAFAACGEGVGGAPLQAQLPDDEVTTPEAVPEAEVVRTVFHRNPHGNVAVTDNLLWDGDFEWRPSFPEQYGWLVGYGFGVTFGLPTLATGSRCKSGIKCAVLGPGENILGIAVGMEDRELLVSFWAFVDDGTCDGVSGALIDSYMELSTAEQIPAVQAEPFEDGWCKFEQLAPARDGAAYLAIENRSGTTMVIDDAVVRPVDPDEQMARRVASPLAASDVARLEALRKSALDLRVPRDPPPSRGREMLAAHLRRLTR